MKKSVKDKNVAYLVKESQLNNDRYIEDINSLLNNGEIPNIFNSEDKGQILELIKVKEGQDY